MTKHARIVAALVSWMRVSTWDTPHPLDQRRFHRAVRDATAAAGEYITTEEFLAAMRELAKKRSTVWPNASLEKRVAELAERAEAISSYVEDLKTPE